LGFDIDQKDKDIMARESGKIKSVAEERVFDELKKGSDAFGAMFRCMSDTGLTKNVLGIDTDAMKDTIHDFRGSHHGESVFEHTIETTQCLDSMSKDNISLKLAGVYHDVGKPYTEEKKDGKIMFLRHEEKSKEICDDTLGKIKGVPRDISDATCWMVGEHIRYPNLSAPNKIASNAVDWKMHNISSKEIADLTKLVECDMSKNIDNLFEKTMVAYNTPKPSGQAFMHLPENMRSQAIRSTWIENATNAIKQMDKNV
jgi:putative nucleotidyltransferase with HDIG domain